jgi:hypothetical protein
MRIMEIYSKQNVGNNNSNNDSNFLEILDIWKFLSMCSRISREILDNFWPIFFQFDLYVGHKCLDRLILTVKPQCIVLTTYNISEFWTAFVTNCHDLYADRLIREFISYKKKKNNNAILLVSNEHIVPERSV